MKGSKWKIGILLLVILMLFSGCASNIQPTTDNESQAPAPQEERLAQLEAELESLKQRELDYKAQIATLKMRVAQLSATEGSDLLTERVTFHYREENGGAVITGYSGSVALLTVPATLGGLPVVAIGEHAFEKASLTAVILPEGITSIGWFAFYECQNLAGVTIPASVGTIGHAVFDGCPALTLHCPAGSYAQQYAQSYAIPYTNP